MAPTPPGPAAHSGSPRRSSSIDAGAAATALLAAALALFAGAAPNVAESDDLLWLEERHGERALQWVRGENGRSERQLRSDPRFAAYRDDAQRSAARLGSGLGWYADGGWIHRFSREPGKVRGVWQRASLADFAASGTARWNSLLDLDALAGAEGKDWFPAGDVEGTVNCDAPRSPRCLIALAERGRDLGAVVREFDTSARQFVPGGFALADTSRFWLEWWDADTLLVAPDLGPETMTRGSEPTPFTVRLWKRGTPVSAAREIWRGSPDDADRVLLQRYTDGNGAAHVLIHQQHDGGSRTYWLLDERAQPQRADIPVSAYVHGISQGHLIFGLEADWPRDGRVLEAGGLLSIAVADIGKPSPRIRVLRAAQERDSGVDAYAKVTKAGVAAVVYANMEPRVLAFSPSGEVWRQRELLKGAHEAMRIDLSDAGSPFILLTRESLVEPPAQWLVNVQEGTARVLAEPSPGPEDTARYRVERFEARSADGTAIPYTLAHLEGVARDGDSPTLIYAYGGNQGSKWPQFSPLLHQLWLRKGGVFVLANVRGGAEFGPRWHRAAVRGDKQRAVDDVIAVAEDLVRRKVTSPRRLGIEGESTGGLVMGAALVQRPDLFGAAVLDVPELDMLRYVELGGGRGVSEYGSPSIPEELEALRRISPYANVRRQTHFPVPLIMSSTEDGIVHPAHARKFAAKLQRLGIEFLYYESPTGGHYREQLSPSDRATVEAYRYVYLARRLMGAGAPVTATR